MDKTDADGLVEQLAAGFEALQGEYQKLYGQHQALERKLATAREQVSAHIIYILFPNCYASCDEIIFSSRSVVACGVDRLFKLTLIVHQPKSLSMEMLSLELTT